MPQTTGEKTTRQRAIDAAGVPTRLMVLGMVRSDGSIVAAELSPVMEACGLSTDQVRSCLRRLVIEGLFVRSGEGKAVTYTATEAGRAVLAATSARTVLAYAQDAAGRGWDRHWRLVAFAVPESHRTARDAFRDRLMTLGGASVHNGLYISPHRWHEAVAGEAKRLGIDAYVTTATTDDLSIGTCDNPSKLARTLWPLDEIAERYRGFIETYRDVPADLDVMRRRGERIAERHFLPGALQIAIHFLRCFEHDPLLPPELLPRSWPGREAREILAHCRRIGLLTRQDQTGPTMFEVYDEAISSLP